MPREPHHRQAVVGWKRRCFGHPHHEAQDKQRQKGRTEQVDVTLQEGKHRPDDQAHAEHQTRAEAVEDDAAGQLHPGVGPAEGREGNAHGHGIETKVAAHARCGNGQRGAVNVVEYGDDEDHHEDEIADVGLRDRWRRRDHYYFPYCEYSGESMWPLRLLIAA